MIDREDIKGESKDPFVSVLMLGYNDKGNLKEAIDSVLEQSYKNFELIYIDNASTDGSLDFVKERYSSVKTINYQENLGYAGAYHKAIDETFRKEKVGAVVLLNTDVLVDKEWLGEMMKTAYKEERIAVVQPKIYLFENKKTNKINTFGNQLNYLGFGYCGNYKKEDKKEFTEDIEIPTASGCSLLIKKEPYLNIRGIDPTFFAYVEDQDICWRARTHGYKVMLSVNAEMWHKYSFVKNKGKFYLYERNRWMFIFKNYQVKTILLFIPIAIVMELGLIANSIFSGYFLDKLHGYLGFCVKLPYIFRERRKVQTSRILKDKDLKDYLSDKIIFEDVGSRGIKIANSILKTYYRLIKGLI